MGEIVNIVLLIIGLIALIAVIFYYDKHSISWIGTLLIGLAFYLIGLSIKAMNMAEIYNNICCGPDAEIIAKEVKSVLLYSWGYNIFAIASIIGWLLLGRSKQQG